MMWQPIETAPNDSLLLVGWDLHNSWVYRVGWYSAGRCTGFDSPYEVRYKPTHWMPLPPPPEETK